MANNRCHPLFVASIPNVARRDSLLSHRQVKAPPDETNHLVAVN